MNVVVVFFSVNKVSSFYLSFFRRKKKCIRFVAGNNMQDPSAASGLVAAEIENIDTNASSNTSTVSTNSPGSPG